MTTNGTRIFLARLAGVGAFEPNGDQVGKVRDVVVALRGVGQPPRTLGMVLEVSGRRRIFLPMTRVTSLDTNQVIVTGTLNMRRFEQRPGETLVMSELFDRRVEMADGSGQVTIMDVGIEQDRSRDWLVSELYVRRPGGGLRRRGEANVVDWNEVRGLNITTGEQGIEHLLATLDNLRAADLANAISDLTPKRRLEVARGLDDERLADVMEELHEDVRVEILQMLEAERAADVLEEMDPDDAADLISELPPDTAADLLERMEPEDADDIRRLLSYGDYTAGGMMTTEPVILSPDATVAEALARVRNPELSASLAAQVYVCRAPLETPSGRYLGTAHFQRLLREPPGTLVASIVDADLEPIGPLTPIAEVTRHFATYNLVAIPVVDEGDHLLGVVTFDDLIDHMLPEDWRDAGSHDEAVGYGNS